MLEGKWIQIFSSTDAFHVEVIKGLLTEHSIECVVVNKKDSFYLIGEVELYVNVEDVFRANQLISDSKS